MRENIEIPIETVTLAKGVRLVDAWFGVRDLDEGTAAIGEPAYHQRNWSYLISDRGEILLWDTGSGRRPIAPLVARRAAGAVTAFPSHMHFDHLGGVHAFGPVIVADLPVLRAVAEGALLTPTDEMFLGHSENVPVPTLTVGRWIAPGETLLVGSRRLEVLHTPGHSPDSVSLWEADRNRFYAADFIYRGALYAQTPGASLRDYLRVTEHLLDLLPSDAEIVGAHGMPVNGADDVPILGIADLDDLRSTLRALLHEGKPHAGERLVNQNMTLIYNDKSFGL